MTPTPDTRHLTPAEVEQWAQGLLPAARELHLAQCGGCRAVADRERTLFRALAQLPRFAPEVGCAERVMAKVKIPTPSGSHLGPAASAQAALRATVPPATPP